MYSMVKKKMFQEIQKLKKEGHNRSFISRELKIDRKTIRKYYNMTDNEFHIYQSQSKTRSKLLESYKKDILSVYESNNFKKLYVSSVYDFLEEKHDKLPVSEKSLRNYIKELQKTGELKLNSSTRVYRKVEDLPFGKQMQLDFGEFKLPSGLKLHIFAVVLSASRMRYVRFQSTPFHTIDVIRHLLDSFDYYGGVPQELVIDQDSTLVSSENDGNIVYTKKFNYFIEEMKLNMYVCRKSDPESKGKIENLVKFVKVNFLNSRDFENLEQANDSLSKWLARKANGRISQATQMIPAELHQEEKKHLRDLRNSIFRKGKLSNREERKVGSDSFISVGGSYYSAPETYRYRIVEILTTEFKVYIYDQACGDVIAEHRKSTIAGRKVIIEAHFRRKSKTIADLKATVLSAYDFPQWQSFCLHNFKTYPRYIRDQCLVCIKLFDRKINPSTFLESVIFCIENGTFTFKELNDTYLYFLREEHILENVKPIAVPTILSLKLPTIDVASRPLSFYNEILKGQVI
jgi:transposase